MTTINLTNFKIFDVAALTEDEIFGLHEENYDLSRDEGACGPAHPEDKNWLYDSSIKGDKEAMVLDIMHAIEYYSMYIAEIDRQNEMA